MRPPGDSELVEHELVDEVNHGICGGSEDCVNNNRSKGDIISISRLGYGSMYVNLLLLQSSNYESNPGFIIIAVFACSILRMRAFE